MRRPLTGYPQVFPHLPFMDEPGSGFETEGVEAKP
jgi:hypothetical protein